MAAILYRYAQYKKYDVSVGEDTNILSFNDVQTISEYAIPALQWACGSGLVHGSNNSLMPAAHTTRAQVAAILQRFMQNVAK
jgi:S-layer homology domain.